VGRRHRGYRGSDRPRSRGINVRPPISLLRSLSTALAQRQMQKVSARKFHSHHVTALPVQRTERVSNVTAPCPLQRRVASSFHRLEPQAICYLEEKRQKYSAPRQVRSYADWGLLCCCQRHRMRSGSVCPVVLRARPPSLSYCPSLCGQHVAIHASRFITRPIVVGCQRPPRGVPIPRLVNSAAICPNDAPLAIRSASTGWSFLARSTAAALFAGASRSAPLRPSRTPRDLAA
jgi:hypothetical protein